MTHEMTPDMWARMAIMSVTDVTHAADMHGVKFHELMTKVAEYILVNELPYDIVFMRNDTPPVVTPKQIPEGYQYRSTCEYIPGNNLVNEISYNLIDSGSVGRYLSEGFQTTERGNLLVTTGNVAVMLSATSNDRNSCIARFPKNDKAALDLVDTNMESEFRRLLLTFKNKSTDNAFTTDDHGTETHHLNHRETAGLIVLEGGDLTNYTTENEVDSHPINNGGIVDVSRNPNPLDANRQYIVKVHRRKDQVQ